MQRTLSHGYRAKCSGISDTSRYGIPERETAKSHIHTHKRTHTHTNAHTHTHTHTHTHKFIQTFFSQSDVNCGLGGSQRCFCCIRGCLHTFLDIF
jgi:carbohydrate-binding DOMON domain-containing protein